MGGQDLRWHAVDDAAALQCQARVRILDAAAAAISARGVFRIVLAGGGTPRATYRSLRDAVTDWNAWRVYFGDERCVPPDDPERNSAMACQAWLQHVSLPTDHIHPIPAERGPEEGARLYADTVRAVGDFDLVLLGLGQDGHTASLFPDHDWGTGTGAPLACAVTDAPKPPPARVSLSAARLGRARQVLFLVDGDDKRDAVARWRAGAIIPASSIQPAAGVDVLVTAKLLAAPVTETTDRA